MATYTLGPELTFVAGANVAAYTLVKMGAAGTVTNSTGVASEDNDVFGVVTDAAITSGEAGLITHLNQVATFKVKAAAAISVGAKVYTAASGKCTSTATSLTCIGMARTAATADGDIIEVLRILGSNDDIS